MQKNICVGTPQISAKELNYCLYFISNAYFVLKWHTSKLYIVQHRHYHHFMLKRRRYGKCYIIDFTL